MTRDRIRKLIDGFLAKKGFQPGDWAWHRSALIILVNGELRVIDLPAKRPIREIFYEMGRLAAIAEMLGLQPPRLRNENGAGVPVALPNPDSAQQG